MRYRLTDEDLKHRIRGRYSIDPVTGCWNWLAGISRTGYGQCRVSQMKEYSAHRVSYRAHKGSIPEGMNVMHSCDNRRCVNPDHLSLGTGRENMEQRNRRRRHAHGEKSPRAKLTEADARTILSLYRKDGITAKAIAARYGISDSTVQHIAYGTRWSHLQPK